VVRVGQAVGEFQRSTARLVQTPRMHDCSLLESNGVQQRVRVTREPEGHAVPRGHDPTPLRQVELEANHANPHRGSCRAMPRSPSRCRRRRVCWMAARPNRARGPGRQPESGP
jgi:hypothetical protein